LEVVHSDCHPRGAVEGRRERVIIALHVNSVLKCDVASSGYRD
jgi:hypothetical protein